MARVDITDIRRRQIIDAALKVVAEKGYHNTTIADIAREMEVGHGTIYRYYENKLDIASAVIQDIIENIAAVVTAEPPDEAKTLEEYRSQLHKIGDRFYDLLDSRPEYHRLLFFEALSIDEAVTTKINNAYALFASYTELYLKNGIKKGFLRPDIHTHETAFAINGMLFEAARRLSLAASSDTESRKAWTDTIIGLMLDGLAQRP
jgi:AcrR family transcriptional regulator